MYIYICPGKFRVWRGGKKRKKNCSNRNCRLDSEDRHPGGRICSESVVFSFCCVRRLCLSVSMHVNQSLLSACFLECVLICLKLFHPELSSRQPRLTFWWSNMLWIGRLLILLCCCVPACVYWNMHPFVQNNAGKKTVSPGTVVWTARTDIPVVQYARNRSSSRSPVLLAVCARVSISLSLSLPLSVWCVWAAAFVVTLFDVGLLWSLRFFRSEVHYIRGKFLEAFELRFSWFRLLSCIFLVSL
jgi:hypothetical protein